MTNEEYEIVQTGKLISERYEWENRCRDCKHLEDVEWYFGKKSGPTHRCSHPDRQNAYSDPRPYGCGGQCYEKKN